MDDPYSSFSYHSKISSSQENHLQLNFHGHEPQASSPASDEDEFPVETTGIVICSPPDGSSSAEDVEYHPTVEEEFQTPEEERFLSCSSEEEPPGRMTLDDYTQYVDDALTLDLGKDSNSVVFSEEKSSPILETNPVDNVVEKSFENDNEVLKNALESTLEKNLGFFRRGSDSLPCVSEEAPESALRNSFLQEDLGSPELKNEGLGGSQLNLSKDYENNFNLNVVDNVELARGEDYVGHVAEKTLESAVEKNPGFLKGKFDNSPCDSEKGPGSSMRKALIEEEDLRLIELKNEGLVESPCNHPIEFENVLNLNVVHNVEPASIEDCVGDALAKTSESTVRENIVLLKCSLDCPPCDTEKDPESLVEVNENDVAVIDSKELDLKSCSDNSKEDFPILHHPDVSESSKDVVMEDTAPIATEELRHDMHTDKVLAFDNMQTDEVHNDDGNTNNKNKELEKSKYADSSNLFPEVPLENPVGLRRLPNWVSAMEESTQSGNRGARKEKNLDLGQKKKAGEAEVLGNVGIRLADEGSDHSGKRFKEAEGSCRVIEVDFGRGGTRSVKEGSDHSGKSFGEAEVLNRVAVALPSRGQPQAIKKSLDTSSFRANQGNRGNNDISKKTNPQTKDIDILEVALHAGLKLPRPRWWRSGGYETK